MSEVTETSKTDVEIKLEEKIEILTRQLKEREKNNQELQLRLMQEKTSVEILEERVKKLTKEVDEKNMEMWKLLETHSTYEKIIKSFFSEAQLQRLIGQKKTHWAASDIADAITLKSISKGAYKYLRRKIGYPLPGLSTLRRWSLKLKVEPGINGAVILLMKAWGKNMTRNEKLTVLSFDETYLSDQVR